jgi:hypothetical protein
MLLQDDLNKQVLPALLKQNRAAQQPVLQKCISSCCRAIKLCRKEASGRIRTDVTTASQLGSVEDVSFMSEREMHQLLLWISSKVNNTDQTYTEGCCSFLHDRAWHWYRLV